MERRIAALAASQHGVVGWAQLLRIGLSAAAIHRRVLSGHLIPIHRGVFAVGHRPPSPLAQAMAAVLVCGDGAVLSHQSAATLWGMLERWRAPVHVTARGRHDHRGVRVHRSRTLNEDCVTVHYGIPVTTPARTALDLADGLGDRALARAVNEGLVRSVLKRDELAALIATSPGRRTAPLTRFAAEAGAPTRSRFEDRFLAFAEAHGVPRPVVNDAVAGHEVDLHWREERLVGELDSRTFHDTPLAFERDRERDADLLAAGYRVVRITWARLTREPAREARRLKRMLAAR